jgi:hypothetical protein
MRFTDMCFVGPDQDAAAPSEAEAEPSLSLVVGTEDGRVVVVRLSAVMRAVDPDAQKSLMAFVSDAAGSLAKDAVRVDGWAWDAGLGGRVKGVGAVEIDSGSGDLCGKVGPMEEGRDGALWGLAAVSSAGMVKVWDVSRIVGSRASASAESVESAWEEDGVEPKVLGEYATGCRITCMVVAPPLPKKQVKKRAAGEMDLSVAEEVEEEVGQEVEVQIEEKKKVDLVGKKKKVALEKLNRKMNKKVKK